MRCFALVFIAQVAEMFRSKRIDLSMFDASGSGNYDSRAFVMIIGKVDNVVTSQRSKNCNVKVNLLKHLLDCFRLSVRRQCHWSALESRSVQHVPNDLLLIVLHFLKLLQQQLLLDLDILHAEFAVAQDVR